MQRVLLKPVAIFIVGVVALGCAIWGLDVITDRSIQLAVVEPAPLYSLPPHEYPQTNPVLLMLQPGQTIHVLRLRYGKDFQAFRVETPDGRVGWVIGGEGVQVVR